MRSELYPFVCLLVLLHSYYYSLLLVEASEEGVGYNAYDDATWAVVTSHLSDPHKQVEYNEFMDQCRKHAGDESKATTYCDNDEAHRLQMNMYQPRSVRNYTKTGFLKIKAPEAVFKIIKEFWDANRDDQTVEWDRVNPYHNCWEAPPSILRVDNSSLKGGGSHLQAAIANAARDAMEAWTGMPQAPASVYGIRSYPNQSILAPHVDRLPLVSSAIINVAQDVDEDWILEVYDHDGVAHNVTMEPGDLVLYESHSVIHGRPFRLQGRFYANIFVHFEPLGLPLDMPIDGDARENYNVEFPPYLIPGSSWEVDWQEAFPDGWELLKDTVSLVQKNDLRTLRYLGNLNPSKLHATDGTSAEWRPIHEAARQGYVDILKFLIEEHGADVNQLTLADGGMTPLDLVNEYVGSNHPAGEYLISMGGVNKKEAKEVIATDEGGKSDDVLAEL